MHPHNRTASEALSAVVGLVGNWTAASTQGSIAREVGLDIAENDIRGLYTIGLHGGSVRPAALAAELQLSRPTASKLIARLVAAGLVDRSQDAGDGRKAQLVLTSDGATSYARLVGAGVQIVERAMADLTADERDSFVCVLQKLRRGFGGTIGAD